MIGEQFQTPHATHYKHFIPVLTLHIYKKSTHLSRVYVVVKGVHGEVTPVRIIVWGRGSDVFQASSC